MTRPKPWLAVAVGLTIVFLAALVQFRTAQAVATRPAAARLYYEMFLACWHDEASEYHCGGDTTGFLDATRSGESRTSLVRFASNVAPNEPRHAATSIPSQDVDSMVLTVYMKDKTSSSKQFPPTADAIFLSRYATQNMLHHYYHTTPRDVKRTVKQKAAAKKKAAKLQLEINQIWKAR